MERDAADVLREALALSPEIRAALIDSLIGSLIKQSTRARKKPGGRRFSGAFSRSTAELFPLSRGMRRAAVSARGWSSEGRVGTRPSRRSPRRPIPRANDPVTEESGSHVLEGCSESKLQ